MAEKYLTDPNTLRLIAEGIFGEERVEVTHTGDANNPETLSLTVHFPEVVMENSAGDRHTLKDLWVQFAANCRYRGTYKLEGYLRGRRSTLSLKEFHSSFPHSHLSSSGIYQWESFCLGSSVFQNIMENLKLTPTEEMWEMMLLSLTNYVSWESLEGGPYSFFRNIRYDGTRVGRITTRHVHEAEYIQELYRLIRHLPREVWDFTPEMELIADHPVLYRFFNDYSRIRRHVIQQGNNSVTQEFVDRETESWRRNYRLFTFKGRSIEPRIYDPNVAAEAHVQEGPQIEKTVVDNFIGLLKQQSSSLLKETHYVQLQQTYQPALRALAAFE